MTPEESHASTVSDISPGIPLSYLWLAGNEGMQKKMETTKMGYRGTTMRIHSLIPC